MPKRTPKSKLGELLRETGRSQRWLSERIGVDESLMSRYVHGLHVPEDIRPAIAEALERKVEDVFPVESREVAA